MRNVYINNSVFCKSNVPFSLPKGSYLHHPATMIITSGIYGRMIKRWVKDRSLLLCEAHNNNKKNQPWFLLHTNMFVMHRIMNIVTNLFSFFVFSFSSVVVVECAIWSVEGVVNTFWKYISCKSWCLWSEKTRNRICCIA